MKKIGFLTILLFVQIGLFAQNQNIVNHQLNVEIFPLESKLVAIDTIEIFGDFNKEFLLNSSLIPESRTKGIQIEKVEENVNASDVGMDRDTENGESQISISKWKISGNANKFVIAFSGKIASEVEQRQENYQRGFSQSAGIICELGTYLAGSTFWVPVFDNKLMTFTLTTVLPKDWKNVTIGERTSISEANGKSTDTWVCDKPQEEVFLIAAKFSEYSYKMSNGTKAMAFLRTPDEGLANKYLEVTEQYMNMFEEMIGKYPYTKFALVENFWETGYGMPSFTLLGEKIIRFPFILHSSYPHELLHNWWGNSVYVDFESGNWCEGITAFMADHLIKEQRGEGEAYRRETLQKFTNYVNPSNDFPLNKFQSRYDAPSEAIGYGKSLMMWQMLRRKLGDKNFIKGIKLFYKDQIYKKASFTDMQKAMEEVSGADHSAFFDQWTSRTGAPEISIKDIKTDVYAENYRINLTLQQTQAEEVFMLDVPVNVVTEKGLETFVFLMDHKTQEFQISLKSKPVKLAVDAQFDVFRILNPSEVPPSLSKIWASTNNIIILPSKAQKEQKQIYLKYAEMQKEADKNSYQVVFDNEIKELPNDKTAWIFGFENRFAAEINKGLSNYSSSFSSDSIVLEGKALVKKSNDFVITLFDETDYNKQKIFISCSNEKAIDGLIRKLPHYGKYSYLAFNGDEPTNIAKGQWDVVNSPLIRSFTNDAHSPSLIEPRQALGTLKAVFSQDRMMKTIEYLSSDELKGRGLGTPELDQAAEYISGKFESAGLKLLKGTYHQKFKHAFHGKGELTLTNVIGVIEGSDEKLKEEPVVVSAHYDHLGLGWPDVHQGDEGKIHHGADDNASGVSILIELAEAMAKTAKPKRTIVFIATTGEEAGLIGSRYFVEHASDYFKGNFFANVNLDTDGSLFDKKLLVLNANTAKEWKYIFMGTDYTTGIKSEIIEKDLDASDQMAFIEKSIPAIQLFTAATENYHKPSDTYEKIDGEGLVKVATVTKEVIEYLSDREDPMPFTGSGNSDIKTSSEPKIARKVSTGSVPDFAYQGVGVKIGSVMEGADGRESPLKAGDIIIAINGKKVDDLKQYSDQLKQYSPGDEISLTVLRNEKEETVKLVLGAR